MNRQVLFHCGHVGTSNVFGNEEAQSKRIAQLELGDCRYCWLKKKPVYFSMRTSQEYGIVLSGHNCYSIREVLQMRGYRFARPVWRKKLVDEAERGMQSYFGLLSRAMLPVSERVARCDREIAMAIAASHRPHTEAEHAGILLWELDWRIERENILDEIAEEKAA